MNQTVQFRDYANPVLSKFVKPAETLVGIWIGINDIGDSAKYDVYFPTFYDELLFASVQGVYDLGYKHFLFMNLPPLDRTPGNVASANPLPNKTMVDWYDDVLDSHARAFEHAHEDSTVLVFDVNTFLNGVMDHAADYGLKNVTGYCASFDQPYINTDPASYGCLPLPEYFWFNTGHMTSHVHQILAGEVERYLRSQ